MELRHLRYFHAAAELLNFSRAAERLHVAQPALSRQIRDLEDELGTRLFDRNRRRVLLTDAGRTFFSHVAKVLAQVDLAVAAARAAARGAGGQLIICSDWRLSIGLIPKTIADFRARFPRVEVVLTDLPMHRQLAALRANRIHIGFLPAEEIASHGDLESLPLLTAEMLAVIGADHPLAHRRSIEIADLRHEPWVRLTGDHADGYRTYVSQVCRLAGFNPVFGPQEAASLEALFTMVGTGFGMALLPDFLRAPRHPLIRFLHTNCAPIELCAVWPRSGTSQLLRQYLAVLRAHSPQAAA
ncbi:MAG TPA: LysR substrate-binding domain-containing protein [Lacunisphaera sp.]|nr:LysR substrate-binding domain-containing protein [Lacunisphaera sp.]